MELSTPYFVNPLEQSHPLFHIGLLLICGYVGGKIANYLKAPRVSGYIVTGMLLSPSMFGIFQEDLVKEELTVITDMALSVIAFSIGGTLELTRLKRLGKHIVWITLIQASAAALATAAVIVALFPLIHGPETSFWGVYFPMAIVIGAISAATAPAATLAVIHEYRAKGPLTTILLGIVTLDDGLTILFYAFAVAMARSLITQGPLSWQAMLIIPGLQIVIALVLGSVVGLCMRALIRFIPSREGMLGVMVGSIFLTCGLAVMLHSSPLLANMVLGFIVTNFVRHAEDLFGAVETIEESLFMIFFTLAGAHLDLQVIQTAGWLAVLIVIGRFAGKFFGTRLGAHISHAPETVKKYLGFGLLPKAGVTVGLILIAKDLFGPSRISEVMVSAVLGSVIINELLSPLLVHYALVKSGEAGRA
jgi:Kef-type K+ transport system membrane component KefB